VDAVVLEVALEPRPRLPHVHAAPALFVVFELPSKDVACCSVPAQVSKVRQRTIRQMERKKDDDDDENVAPAKPL